MNNNKPEQKEVRKKYSPQFKDLALERIAKDLGLGESLSYSWKSQRNIGGDSIESQKLQQAEIARLKRENASLAEENAFLKKAATYFAKESK